MNEKRMKRLRVSVVCLSIILSFIVFALSFQLLWYYKSVKPYDAYLYNMKVFEVRKSYIMNEDGFLYNVKCPEYPAFTGNLGVSYEDSSVSIIIWLKYGKIHDFGVVAQDTNGNTQMFYINASAEALDSEYKECALENKEKIQELLQKAEKYWNLKLSVS